MVIEVPQALVKVAQFLSLLAFKINSSYCCKKKIDLIYVYEYKTSKGEKKNINIFLEIPLLPSSYALKIATYFHKTVLKSQKEQKTVNSIKYIEKKKKSLTFFASFLIFFYLFFKVYWSKVSSIKMRKIISVALLIFFFDLIRNINIEGNSYFDK